MASWGTSWRDFWDRSQKCLKWPPGGLLPRLLSLGPEMLQNGLLEASWGRDKPRSVQISQNQLRSSKISPDQARSGLIWRDLVWFGFNLHGEYMKSCNFCSVGTTDRVPRQQRNSEQGQSLPWSIMFLGTIGLFTHLTHFLWILLRCALHTMWWASS